MTVFAFAAGWITGWIILGLVFVVLRRELALYRRAQGRAMTFEHRSRS